MHITLLVIAGMKQRYVLLCDASVNTTIQLWLNNKIMSFIQIEEVENSKIRIKKKKKAEIYLNTKG